MSRVFLVVVALFARFWSGVVKVYTAVAQLAVVQVGLFGALACQFGHTGYGLALLLALLYLLFDNLCHIGVLVQKVIHILLYKVAHKLVHAHARQRKGFPVRVLVGGHGERAELDFCLTLKQWLYHTYGYGCHQTVAHVLHIVVLAEILLYGLGYVLLKGTLVRTALGGMLSVNKRVILLTILRGVGKGYVDVGPRQVYNGVQTGGGHVVVEQVLKSVAAQYAPPVVKDGKSGVEVGVVAEHVLNKLTVEAVVLKQRTVWFKKYVSAVFLLARTLFVAHEHTFLKYGLMHLAIAHTACYKAARQGINSLQAHTIHTHRGGEHCGVVLAARVEF